jgi:hypothetical protein
MTNRKDNRVLCRRGARELTLDEAEFVSGAGAVHTLFAQRSQSPRRPTLDQETVTAAATRILTTHSLFEPALVSERPSLRKSLADATHA